MMQIGVVGAGAMGAGIAQVAAQAGHPVVLYDTNAATLAEAGEKLRVVLNRLEEKGKLPAGGAEVVYSRLEFADNMKDFKGCGLIIEAIVERLEVKQNVFRILEDVAAPEAVLASNTSSLSITSIAGGLNRPERVIGIHFFNPAPLMPLVEVVPGLATEPGLAEEMKDLMKSWGKVPVVAKDTPGFIVNRVARPFYGEAIRLVEEGMADMPTVDWAMTSLGGFRMGPFTLMDFIGHDVNYTVTESVFHAFFQDPRYKPSFLQKRLVEAGWLGVKTKRGFYDYREGAEKPVPTEDPELGRVILDRILAMLINEAADALYLGIATAEDLDLAMTRGVNYPKGLLAWANERGIASVVEQLDALYNEYREDRYRCSVLLRRMARSGNKFGVG